MLRTLENFLFLLCVCCDTQFVKMDNSDERAIIVANFSSRKIKLQSGNNLAGTAGINTRLSFVTYYFNWRRCAIRSLTYAAGKPRAASLMNVIPVIVVNKTNCVLALCGTHEASLLY